MTGRERLLPHFGRDKQLLRSTRLLAAHQKSGTKGKAVLDLREDLQHEERTDDRQSKNTVA